MLEPGDIVVRIGGELITDFVTLEATLDASIGQTLLVNIIRQGLKKELNISVADLHALAPVQLLELGDAVLQDMSIQHARAMNKPQKGVVVVEPGYVFTRANVPGGAVIIEVEGQAVENLQGFIDAVNASASQTRKRVRFIVPGREFSSELGQFQLADRWFDQRLCSRVDDARFWDCQDVELPGPSTEAAVDDVQVPSFRDPLLQRVAPAMVKVDFSIPYPAENVYARHFKGVGLVIDDEAGLIAVDRNTVPIALGDAQLTFFGSAQLKGTVVFVHPRHNVALIQYDPAQLRNADVQALPLSARNNAELPDDLTMVGYRADGTFRTHPIDDISALTVGFNPPRLARFQQSSLDLFSIPNVPPSLGGPLVDADGNVHAVYMSFAFEDGREIRQREWAMPAAVVAQSLELFKSGEPYYSMDTQLAYRPLYIASQLGLPASWLARFNALPFEQRRVLYVEQVVPSTQAAEILFTGDVILAINDELVSGLFTAETRAQQASVSLTVLRAGDVLDITLQPTALDILGTQRVVSWAGAYFQMPFTDIGFQKGVDFPGVYVADTVDGSPALWDELYRNRFIVAIDGEPINNLDEFLSAVLTKEQDQITRLTTISISGRKSIVTVQPEYNFWPTFEITNKAAGWQRIDY